MNKEAKKLNPLTMTDQELIEHCNKQVQALRMALDMIECEKHDRRHVRWAIVDALKEWQPAQQEPVAYGMWDTMLGKDNRMMMVRLDKGQDGCAVPLYTTPQPTRKPLTDEKIEDDWERITGHSIFGGNRADGRAMYISPDEVREFARAIEAALNIKE